MDHKKFGELSRDEKLTLMAAWLDGETIEARDRLGSWGRSLYPSWMESGIYRAITKPVVKPSINWDHVAEKFVALAVDEDGTANLFSSEVKLSGEEWIPCSAFATYGDAAIFSSLRRGDFAPNTDGIVKNWQDSLVLRPGFEPKES